MQKLLDAGVSNPELLEQLYQDYLSDPNSVHPSMQEMFASLPEGAALPPSTASASSGAVGGGDSKVRIYRLIDAYRHYGHLAADVNPINANGEEEPERLKLSHLGFEEADLERSFPCCGLMQKSEAPLKDIVAHLQSTYSGRIAVEYMGIHSPELERFVQERLEPIASQPAPSIEEKRLILNLLNQSELLEVFLHTKYTGQKRFSLEGAETLIPMLEAVVQLGPEHGLQELVLGMAHRGRLNVLANILRKSYRELFSEFEEGFISDSFEGSGDVKYHKGFTITRKTSQDKNIAIMIPDNPSHLEAVDGVVEGMVRARQVLLGDDHEMTKVMPILIHGDAAVAGQGVVYEVMQMGQLPGYGTGGTLHIVINNQIGFTTLPKDARSTRYCTDIARGLGAPIFHVNAEDPEACLLVTQLSIEIRQRFGCDVFIDLNGYRKFGHNEGDEPAFTQPLQYTLIRKKQPIRELYRDELIKKGVLEQKLAEQLEGEFRDSLQAALDEKKFSGKTAEQHSEQRRAWQERGRASLFTPVETAVKKENLRDVAQRFCTVPEGFNIHRKLGRLVQQRLAMLEGDEKTPSIDWGMAEHLAFGTLIMEGRHVRVSGQDSRRGTFSHRHAMWLDQKTAEKYFPLSRLADHQGRFDIFNSPLSEYGVMAFEFGYSITYPHALVCWEAQFGDFCNTAQVVIDQFISTAEQKWRRHSRLCLMLPHGMEGQGPEHSSARMERFLQLSGDNNMLVVNPTAPAQLFHVLRRQVLAPYQKPLIMFTPKGLLRHPKCLSGLNELSVGGFREIIDDPQPPKKAKRLVFCSGRVYYDLLQAREEAGNNDVALIRLEQLYPFYYEGIEAILQKYEGFDQAIWVQEEPKNMGAWHHVRPFFRRVMPEGKELEYIGRARSASPATGSPEVHQQELRAILKTLYGKLK